LKISNVLLQLKLNELKNYTVALPIFLELSIVYNNTSKKQRCNDTLICIGIGSFWVAIQYINTGSAYCDEVKRNFNN